MAKKGNNAVTGGGTVPYQPIAPRQAPAVQAQLHQIQQHQQMQQMPPPAFAPPVWGCLSQLRTIFGNVLRELR